MIVLLKKSILTLDTNIKNQWRYISPEDKFPRALPFWRSKDCDSINLRFSHTLPWLSSAHSHLKKNYYYVVKLSKGELYYIGTHLFPQLTIIFHKAQTIGVPCLTRRQLPRRAVKWVKEHSPKSADSGSSPIKFKLTRKSLEPVNHFHRCLTDEHRTSKKSS